jgi:hypothetical protein
MITTRSKKIRNSTIDKYINISCDGQPDVEDAGVIGIDL